LSAELTKRTPSDCFLAFWYKTKPRAIVVKIVLGISLLNVWILRICLCSYSTFVANANIFLTFDQTCQGIRKISWKKGLPWNYSGYMDFIVQSVFIWPARKFGKIDILWEGSIRMFVWIECRMSFSKTNT